MATPVPVWTAETTSNTTTVIIPVVVVAVVVIVLGCCCVRQERRAMKRQREMHSGQRQRRYSQSDEETGEGEEVRMTGRQVQMAGDEEKKKKRKSRKEKEREEREKREERYQNHVVSPAFPVAEDPAVVDEDFAPLPQNPASADPEGEAQEYRQDPADGQHYNLQSFFEAYGEEEGLARWEMAADTAIFPTAAQITEKEAAEAVQEDFP